MRAAGVRRLCIGGLTSISLYNRQAFPVLSYVASFLPPPKKAIRAHRKAVQKILAMPRHAIPTTACTCLKELGLPRVPLDVQHFSIVARFRAF